MPNLTDEQKLMNLLSTFRSQLRRLVSEQENPMDVVEPFYPVLKWYLNNGDSTASIVEAVMSEDSTLERMEDVLITGRFNEVMEEMEKAEGLRDLLLTVATY